MAVEDHIIALTTRNQELEEDIALALSIMTPDMREAYWQCKGKRQLEKQKEKKKTEATGELSSHPTTSLDC